MDRLLSAGVGDIVTRTARRVELVTDNAWIIVQFIIIALGIPIKFANSPIQLIGGKGNEERNVY